MHRYGAVLLGGTKIACAVGEGARIETVETFPTGDPTDAFGRITAFFTKAGADIRGVGVGSFGPVDLASGTIAKTPKPGWSDAPVGPELSARLGVPVVVDTDVNVEGLGEFAFGAAQGLSTFIYLTVGTGIGGGGISNGQLMHGLVHPEMGHIRVVRDPSKDSFAGACPFHGDCLEGLASGPAMQVRWGVSAKELPPDHPAWELETDYIAQALAAYTLVLSPQRIIVGGGVALTDPAVRFFERMRHRVQAVLAGYIQHNTIVQGIDQFIVPPSLEQPGLIGGFELARRTLER